jgi:hypothetical protein
MLVLVMLLIVLNNRVCVECGFRTFRALGGPSYRFTQFNFCILQLAERRSIHIPRGSNPSQIHIPRGSNPSQILWEGLDSVQSLLDTVKDGSVVVIILIRFGCSWVKLRIRDSAFR